MKDMITAIVVFTGLMVGGGLAIRRRWRLASASGHPAAASSGRDGPPRPAIRKRGRHVRPRHLRVERAAPPRWLRRLRCEEQRQRPQEGRN